MKALDYVEHALIEPPYYQRDYEHDLPEAAPEWMETAGRVALIALPFISLYRPCGQVLSIGLGGLRIVSEIHDAVIAGIEGEGLACAWKVTLAVISTVCLAGTIFNFSIGLALTTVVDLIQHLIHAVQHLQQEDYIHFLEDLLQIASCALYLAIMATGSFEVIIASLFVQAVINFMQAYPEWEAGRWPEAIAKLVMGNVRVYQAREQWDLLQMKKTLEKVEAFAQLIKRVGEGRKASHLISSSLGENEPVILTDAEGRAYDFGAYDHGSGKGLVKGMNLEWRIKEINGEQVTQLDFKVNHVFRDQLQVLIGDMQRLDPKQIDQALSLSHSHAKGLRIHNVSFPLSEKTGKTMGAAWKFSFDGLGSVTIAGSKEFPNIYDRVKVEIKGENNLFRVHELLSFFNLNDALRNSSQEDRERLKLGHLFRIFYPTEATRLERDEQFFSMPTEQLRAEMIKQAPDMQEKMTRYLDTMTPYEILPGKVRYRLPGLSDEVYALGGRGLITTITGANGTEEFNRTASILKMGMFSSEMRYSHDMDIKGLSVSSDFYTGGADSVFTQFLTEKNVRDEMSLYNLYWGNVRILFSLDAIEMGTYQYHSDEFGIRHVGNYLWNSYPRRPGILDFTQREQTIGFSRGNEVMIKDRIAPEMIKGLIVPNEATKHALLDTLRQRGVTTMHGGIEMVRGVPVDRFIHTGNRLTSAMMA